MEYKVPIRTVSIGLGSINQRFRQFNVLLSYPLSFDVTFSTKNGASISLIRSHYIRYSGSYTMLKNIRLGSHKAFFR
jgi:hypothetical protein